MSLPQATLTPPLCPASDALRQQLHQRLDDIIDDCLHQHAHSSFLLFEKALLCLLASLGRLLMQLFLQARQEQLDLTPWLQRYRIADDKACRTLKTACGPVHYRRVYLTPRRGKAPGIHPLDIALGLTRDAFSPLLIGWFCRLATRLSFRLASELGGMFLPQKPPPPSAIEEWVLGLGRPAYEWHQSGPLPEKDGEVLVIECDGKAVPTATEQELRKRRGPRQKHGKGCRCQRHRGRQRRKRRGPKRRRRRGDKSKNGRSATLVAMYTLRRGEDGRLHGPCNKKIYASFSSRKTALEWAREQATRRGFGLKTDKTVQILVDGETCLEQNLRALFPRAILTLDIRHAQERLWLVGRLFHAEGSTALASWVEPLAKLLYQGKVATLLERLRQAQQECHGPGSKAKRRTMDKAIGYLEKRQGLMDYGVWRQQDLVLASGVVEGAARYVIGERLDQSGMRWKVQRAEALLQLRCIEVNGDWDAFFDWAQEKRLKELEKGQAVQIRSKKPTQLPETLAASEKRRQRREKEAIGDKPAKAAA